MDTISGQPLTRAQERKAVFAATIGCGLEFYDFLTFAFFAIQIGETFFPSESSYLSLMGSLATFGAGFLGRPLGAWVLGGYGDRAGRKPAMLLSMTMMGVAIAVLALTPGYATIGIAAPIIVIVARFVQGIALGGEIGSATVYMLEAGSIERRGRNAAYQGVCQGVSLSLGALVGFGLSAWLTPAELASYGWRIALLLGVSIVPFALMLRRTLPETQGCEEPDMPAMTDGPSFRQIVWLGSSLMAAGTVVTYFQSYMVTFGQRQLHLTTQASMAGQLVGNVMIIVAALIGGAASDKWGRKPVIVWPQLCLVLTIVPILTWLETAPSLGAFLAINIALGMFNNVTSAPLYATIAESLTAERRAKGFALIYSVPVTIFGGTTQLFITWLLEVTGSTIALGIYMTCIAALGLLAAVLLPESAPVRRGWKPAIA